MASIFPTLKTEGDVSNKTVSENILKPVIIGLSIALRKYSKNGILLNSSLQDTKLMQAWPFLPEIGAGSPQAISSSHPIHGHFPQTLRDHNRVRDRVRDGTGFALRNKDDTNLL